jgi:hypothetical protein
MTRLLLCTATILVLACAASAAVAQSSGPGAGCVTSVFFVLLRLHIFTQLAVAEPTLISVSEFAGNGRVRKRSQAKKI